MALLGRSDVGGGHHGAESAAAALRNFATSRANKAAIQCARGTKPLCSPLQSVPYLVITEHCHVLWLGTPAVEHAAASIPNKLCNRSSVSAAQHSHAVAQVDLPPALLGSNLGAGCRVEQLENLLVRLHGLYQGTLGVLKFACR